MHFCIPPVTHLSPCAPLPTAFAGQCNKRSRRFPGALWPSASASNTSRSSTWPTRIETRKGVDTRTKSHAHLASQPSGWQPVKAARRAAGARNQISAPPYRNASETSASCSLGLSASRNRWKTGTTVHELLRLAGSRRFRIAVTTSQQRSRKVLARDRGDNPINQPLRQKRGPLGIRLRRDPDGLGGGGWGSTQESCCLGLFHTAY